nr:probable leucine-rich repeat receptor-like serine/threonine-protein kinase At3g14840 [Tanacetum cinerariifolium]
MKNHTSLYINCGGGGRVSFEDKLYEDDAETGGPAHFQKTDDRWGFSNTGHFLGDNNRDNYIVKSAFGVPVNSSELYKSARRSALSLTYYGLCMHNGSYNISLHFAEIQFTDDRNYSSLGRRVFDIYIQGMLVEKDFDISNEAGGAGKVIVKTYTVNVMTTLEIRLYWAGKGTITIPHRGVYGPLISAISVNPNFWVPPNDRSVWGNGNSVSAGTVAGIVVGAVCVIILILGVLWWQGCLRHTDTNKLELNGVTGSFTLRQIKTATNNFSDANKIGEGGFGSVYKGVLPDGTLIAVKQLSSNSRQGNREFLNELGVISALQHPHLVKLHGCCIEGNQLLLAYEYMENNSLAQALFGISSIDFNWSGTSHGIHQATNHFGILKLRYSQTSVGHQLLTIPSTFSFLLKIHLQPRGLQLGDFWVPPNDRSVWGNGNSVSAGTVAGIVVGAVCVIILILGVLWWQGCLRHTDTNKLELNGVTGSFTLRQIKTATNNFSDANKIGEGGFGSVYKGVLPDGTLIAVKQLSSNSRQGNREFLNELGVISALQHPHLVKLHGCCIEGNQLLLAYEYMENNSLAQALFGPKEWQLVLDWPTRYRICIDIARGLAFLHEESRLKIVHRDMKAANVLLDKDLKAKISDFGLAKLDEEDKTHISTRIAGTCGYMAPEYALRGYLTDKADVYSYGIVLLEVVSGMANVADRAKENLFVLRDRAVALNNTGNIMELVDSRLGSEYDMQEMMVVINLALLCTTTSPTDRPTMSSVVGMLEGRIVPQSFVSEQSMSMTQMDREKMMKQLESTTESQIKEMSIPSTDSFKSAVDLYPVDHFSEYLQKIDNDANKLLS